MISQKLFLGFLLPLWTTVYAADWSVGTIDGVPQLLQNGAPCPVRLYFGNYYYGSIKNGINSPMPDEIRLAADAGIHIISFNIYPSWCKETEKRDYALMDDICDHILAAHPRTLLLPRIKLDAPYFPDVDQSQQMKYAEGHKDPYPQVSIASRRYQKEAPEVLRATIRHLEARYGDKMVGYHPGGGMNEEWQYKLFAEPNFLNGYDSETLIGFRNFLREKYHTDAALAKAWNRPGMTFVAAMVPSAPERRGKLNQAFHDPQAEQNVIDFNFFQNDDMAKIVLSLAKVIREECGKRRLSCFFYGYVYELSSQRNGPGVSGHYAFRRLLNSPDIDIFCGPFSYNLNARVLGGSVATHSASDSVLHAGKIWLNEDDTTTPLAIRQNQCASGDHRPSRDNAETRQLFRRNLAFCYARNQAIWWMDLYGSGWHKDPELWTEMKSFLPLEKQLLDRPQLYSPDVALTIDEKSMKYITSSQTAFDTTRGSCCHIRNRLSLAAVAYGTWLLDDAINGRIDSKLDIHCGAFALSGEQRIALRKRAEKNATIWLWASGYIDLDQNQFSPNAVKELTGFEVKPATVSVWTAFSTPFGMFYGLPEYFGWGQAVAPAFSPVPEAGDEILANFDNGQPAMILRPGKNGHAPAVFVGTNDLPPALIRQVAKLAGAWVYSSTDLNVHANPNFLAVTAPHDACYDINVGGNAEWKDALTDAPLGKGPVLSLRMKMGNTLVMQKCIPTKWSN